MVKKTNKTITIGSTDFQVQYLPVVMVDEGENIYGATHTQDKWIKISTTKNPTKEAENQTLFHEIIHAALGVSGISDVIGDEKLEEGIVVCLENTLWKLIEFRKGIFK